MIKKKDLQIMLEVTRLCYTTLRRAICYGHKETGKTYNREELEKLCHLIEGEDIKQISKIHKEWIGY